VFLRQCLLRVVKRVEEKEGERKKYINTWAWLCCNKTLFTKLDDGLDVVHGLSLTITDEEMDK